MKYKVFFLVLFSFSILSTESLSSQNKTNSSSQVKSLIAKKRNFNNKYGYGYRIQIYYGNETKARKYLNKFKIDFPKVYTKLLYKSPEWKVQVGNYKTRLEADKAKLKFEESFSNIIVIPLGK